MDQVREFFYWTVSIVAILFGIFIIIAISVAIYIRKLARDSINRIEGHIANMSSRFGDASRTWRNLAISRFFFRIFKMIF